MAQTKNFLAKAATWQKSLNNLKRTINKAELFAKKLGISTSDDFICQALIQALEMSIESLWKFIRIVLIEQHGIDAVASPKGVFHQALSLNIISQEEFDTLANILDSRNLMAHTYDQEQAEHIVEKIMIYATLMEQVGQSVSQ